MKNLKSESPNSISDKQINTFSDESIDDLELEKVDSKLINFE